MRDDTLPGFIFPYPPFVFHFTVAGNKLQIPLNLPWEKGEVKKAKEETLNRSRIESGTWFRMTT